MNRLQSTNKIDPAYDGALITATGLTKIYDTGEVKVHALRGVDLEIKPGELIVLLGPANAAALSE